MEILIFKSAVCLAILIIFYKLVLEQRSFHHLKRFYLLGAVILSIVIPFITITQYIQVPINSESIGIITNTIPENTNDLETLSEESINYIPIILWFIYSLGFLIYASKFYVNLKGLYTRIYQNERRKTSTFIHVLLKDILPPHTFFNYIFLNKSKFENNSIPNEVLLHEETHAKQKHSIDILFIELIQVVFWFNPLFSLIKKDIKLNHEFLADAAVLKKGISPTTYQQTLLQFSSKKHDFQLANAINYSSIKKRFTLMKTQTSKQKTWLVSLMIIPLLAAMVYGFSARETIEVHPENIKYAQINGTQVNGVRTKLLLEEINHLSVEHSTFKVESFEIMFPNNKTYKINGHTIDDSFYSEINNLNVGDIVTISKIKNSGNIDIVPVLIELIKQQKPLTAEEIKEYNDWAKKIHSQSTTITKNAKQLPVVEKNNLKKYISIYNRMTLQQKEYSEKMPFPDFQIKSDKSKILTSTLQQKVPTAEEVAEYNTWAKKLKKETLTAQVNERNGKTANYPIVKQKDLVRYVGIYKRMTSKQKQNSVELPLSDEELKKTKLKFPPPPPPQQKGATKKQMAEYNSWAKEINKAEEKNEKGKKYRYPILKAKDVKKFKAIYNSMTEAQRKNAEPWPNIPPPPPPPPAPKAKNGNGEIPPPPPPPKPNKQNVTIEEIEVPAPPSPLVPITDVERYAKEHPKSVSKAKVNGEVVEIVEIAMDEISYKGKTYSYHIKNDKSGYVFFNKSGHIIDEQMINTLTKLVKEKNKD